MDIQQRIKQLEHKTSSLEVEMNKKNIEIERLSNNQKHILDVISNLDKALQNLTDTINKVSVDLARNDVLTEMNSKNGNWLRDNWDKLIFIGISVVLTFILNSIA